MHKSVLESDTMPSILGFRYIFPKTLHPSCIVVLGHKASMHGAQSLQACVRVDIPWAIRGRTLQLCSLLCYAGGTKRKLESAERRAEALKSTRSYVQMTLLRIPRLDTPLTLNLFLHSARCESYPHTTKRHQNPSMMLQLPPRHRHP